MTGSPKKGARNLNRSPMKSQNKKQTLGKEEYGDEDYEYYDEDYGEESVIHHSIDVDAPPIIKP